MIDSAITQMDIPVMFEFNGKTYRGYFSKLSVNGLSAWQLKVNSRHCGNLIYSDDEGWRFVNLSGKMAELKDYFADVIVNWYQ